MLAAALKRLFVPALILIGLLAAPVRAAQAAEGDPPARAGRVAEVIGDAWLFDAESKEWVRVTRNQTVAEGDRLRTDERARVSLTVGSTSLWLDERSDLEFSQLDEGRVLLMLAKGDMGLSLRSQAAVSEYKVQTREGRFYAEQQGMYRVEQMDRGSRGFAFKGRLRFEFERGEGSQPVWLQNGEQAEFWWAGGPRTERQRLGSDSFGEWLLAQSRAEGDRFASGVSQRYVSPEMTGADELDRHGRWESSSEYGNVWIPTAVAVDWAPYRYGRWAWSRHWGWTWVDDAPWGYAPFHYGRWVTYGGRWVWSPGRYVSNPVYAPALVAWVGGVSVGVGGGYGYNNRPYYGWYPLGPREVYVPPYRHSPAHNHRINIDPDPVTVKRPHSNRDVVGAVSYLPGQGGPVRAMPVGEVRPVRPLPVAPARNDLMPVLPARGANEAQVKPAPADMPWRSENLGRREHERDRERDPVLTQAREQARDPARERARQQLPDASGAPATARALPVPEVRNEAQQGVQRQERADRIERLERQEQQQRQDVMQSPSQVRQAADRAMEQMRERQGPSRAPGFERPAERQIERQFERPTERPTERPIERPAERQRAAEPMPMPQVQMPAPRPQPEVQRPAHPQRQEDAGPRRNRAEEGQRSGGERANGERRRSEVER
ncbi:hypothetical protein LNV08_22600 [Paucibacter sp. TC2R-5]|uniref:DUF6600 domain-containing protein n=1 Tax=Paucibacter sp. TC2R-5 TaxID=2893555 RepID=UPI0021E39DEB|nr:DUF6600 domain-containing protein [Paucibacter sp. TC2R-5]MCV2361759.1 hypothetical protein [Paucibacter sp. TC2R-5]